MLGLFTPKLPAVVPCLGREDGMDRLMRRLVPASKQRVPEDIRLNSGAGVKLPAFFENFLPEIVLAVLSAATIYFIISTPLTHDVVWQLWISKQTLAGKTLYEDIWELNPPLWFWSSLPVVWLGNLLNTPPSQILVIAVTVMGAISALLIGSLSQFGSSVHRCAAMLGCFCAMVPLHLFDFGQREQLALITTLPYAALIARRSADKTVPWALAVAVGMFAAYGFALKHYFVVIPILLETWLIRKQKKEWTPLRPEAFALILAALVYAVSIILWAPAFLTRMVPMISAAYHGYEVPFAMMFDELAQVIWAGALLALLRDKRTYSREMDALVAVFLLVALGFGFSYFIQMKGWAYHALPVTGALIAAIIVRITAKPLRDIPSHPLGTFVLFAAAGLAILIGPYTNWLRVETEPSLRSVRRGEAVAILAADPMFMWPSVDKLGLRWPLKVYSHWMLPAIGDVAVRRSDPALTGPLAVKILQETIGDLRCDPPALIMIEKMELSYDKQRSFDIKNFFMLDREFSSFVKSFYREEAGTLHFAQFRRIAKPEPACSAVSKG